MRFRFAKLGKVRFTSHRDVARLFERALRRASLPVVSTEGFSPHPKVHFGLALSTGHESLGEYLDVDLREPPPGPPADLPSPVEGFPALLTPMLPDGLTVEAAAVIDRSLPSLQEAVTSCSWRIELPDVDRSVTQGGIDALLAADRIPVTRERKGKPVDDDLRPAVLELALAESASDPVTLEVELATQPRGVRPSELIAALASFAGVPMEEGRVCRTHQWIELDGARREPLSLGVTRAPHAPLRAS